MITGIRGSWIKVGHFMLELRVAIRSVSRLSLPLFSPQENLRCPCRTVVVVVFGVSLPVAPSDGISETSTGGGGVLMTDVNQLAMPALRLATGTLTEM